jgi:hypothetical protein
MNLTIHFNFLQILYYFVFYHSVSTSMLLVGETGHTHAAHQMDLARFPTVSSHG